jgi:membrane glycosyltransferase
VKAFVENCGLPELPGKPPLGGEIHSHDYVEAALMRRGGWRCYLVPDLGGSFEELPGNILTFAARDRRWCQGNLQHLKLLGAKGLHSINRLHLLQGACAYLASPLWVAFLLLSTADVIGQAISGHAYFTSAYQLYPNWPISKLTETVSLFVVTMGMLFLPKILAFVLALSDAAERKRYGGTRRAVMSLGSETLFSMLIAPVMGCLHSYFIVSLLAGRGVAWKAQDRTEKGLRVSHAVSSVGILMIIGIAWVYVLFIHAPDYVLWVAPVLAGLLLSIPITLLSSRPDLGRWLRRQEVFLTPEESVPTAEIEHMEQVLSQTVPGDGADVTDTAPMTPPVQLTPMPPQSFDGGYVPRQAA